MNGLLLPALCAVVARRRWGRCLPTQGGEVMANKKRKEYKGPPSPGPLSKSALGAYAGAKPAPGYVGPPIPVEGPSKAMNRAARAHHRSRR
jgi:hypothetical protein